MKYVLGSHHQNILLAEVWWWLGGRNCSENDTPNKLSQLFLMMYWGVGTATDFGLV